MAKDLLTQRVVLVAGWLKLPPGICVGIAAKDIRQYAGLIVRLRLEPDLKVFVDFDRFVLWVPLSGSTTQDDFTRSVLTAGRWPGE